MQKILFITWIHYSWSFIRYLACNSSDALCDYGNKHRLGIEFGKDGGANNGVLVAYQYNGNNSTNNALHIYFLCSGPQVNLQPTLTTINTPLHINDNTGLGFPVEGYGANGNGDSYFKTGSDINNCQSII